MAAGISGEPVDEDEYDEEADSDFDVDTVDGEADSSSEDDTKGIEGAAKPKTVSKAALDNSANAIVSELDSGDEATIKEQERYRKRQRKKGLDVAEDNTGTEDGWRAHTRAMRIREKEGQKQTMLATRKPTTIDVDKIWEEMNTPGPLPPVLMEGVGTVTEQEPCHDGTAPIDAENKENLPAVSEEMITIKRKFKFAGEVHVEEKIVPKTSAEARLWLSQQEGRSSPAPESANQSVVQRPLRKISRFDPNYNNLAAFKSNWTHTEMTTEQFKGPKLNVVEKSKMDWAVHVDAEGLKDELDVHARAKEGYHSRMDFLGQVEQRKEEEARQARLKG